MKRISIRMTAVLLALALTGCVERLIRVTSEPAGAIVWLNDEEIGATPTTASFMWYGHYEVALRKDGYQTLKTSRQAKAPFYEWPGIDLVAECLLPWKIVDEHQWHFDLTPLAPTDPNALLERAQSLRSEALTQP